MCIRAMIELRALCALIWIFGLPLQHIIPLLPELHLLATCHSIDPIGCEFKKNQHK